MNSWIITQHDFVKEQMTANENRFFCGNGYLGIRGSLEEWEKDKLPAINLAGIYDRVGEGWREPLNAPNGLFTRLKVGGEYYTLPEKKADGHTFQLNYRHGIVKRETLWCTNRGKIDVSSQRFASLKRPHLICLKYTVSADFHADIKVITGIDSEVWDIHGPHYDNISYEMDENTMIARAITHEKKDQVIVMEQCKIDFYHQINNKEEDNKALHCINFVSKINRPVIIEKKILIYTSNDCENPLEAARQEMKELERYSYLDLVNEQLQEWEDVWETSEVEIEGDAEAMEAINYSLYHLLSIAPRHTKSQSIAARGLSGQTYKGAVFWDTEMFMLDFFVNTNPAVAKTLLQYRIDTLDGAKEKAKQYGYKGAFYAWESQEGGFDACSDYNVTDVFTGRPMRTFFKDKQIHISGAIVYGIMNYFMMTGDTAILEQGGAKVIIECALFYDSALIQRKHSSLFELLDVIGPDEYHERVNNNGYTNRMAKYVFETACMIMNKSKENEIIKNELADYSISELWDDFRNNADNIYLPQKNEEGIVEQFDGYQKLEDVSIAEVRKRLLHEKEYWGGAYGVASHTQVIKQADVITWMVMFPNDFTKTEKWHNWLYYEPRTEHGSSLSACMYGILACDCGKQEAAYPFFLKSAQVDLLGSSKEWAGEVYIGGTHPASAGGAYMTIIKGFAGIKIENNQITALPKLPSHWKSLRFHISYQNELYEIHIVGDVASIKKITKA